MHACGIPEVVYSGEFCILKNTEKGFFLSLFPPLFSLLVTVLMNF